MINRDLKHHISEKYRLTLFGLILSIAFWFVEALIDVIFWEGTSYYTQIIAPGGHEIWMRVAVIGLFVLLGFYGDKIVRARREAENAAKTAHAETQQIFETAADGLRVVDKEFNIISANKTL